MSSTKENYINLGHTCVAKIEDTFGKQCVEHANTHKNKIIQLNERVERLCNEIGKKRTSCTSTGTIDKLIYLNNDLYRTIFEEEPPTIHGHKLHVAITTLERICVLLLQNDCLSTLKIKPTVA